MPGVLTIASSTRNEAEVLLACVRQSRENNMPSLAAGNTEYLSPERATDRKLPRWLGVSMVTVGVIEGVVEGVAATTRFFSAAISDYFRKRNRSS